jgi:protein-S-isoprenylcysteine O-methyltransferase Ste14
MFKRSLFFVYGVLVYLFFLGTFAYAAAFVGGFAPTSLDAAASTPTARALVVDLALLAAFALQHSIMARRWFKGRWTRIVPCTIERSTYVLCATCALALLCWQWRPLGWTVWALEAPAARTALWAIFALGWLQVLVMTFLINHFDLFGLRQVWLAFRGRPYTRVPFATPAPYRFVRHPLYLGFLLAFWAAPTMTMAHLVFAVMTTAYILVAIQFEERDLTHEHGMAYVEYLREVPMLVPMPRREAVREGTDVA